jgi:hypothetical protein
VESRGGEEMKGGELLGMCRGKRGEEKVRKGHRGDECDQSTVYAWYGNVILKFITLCS